MTPKQFIEKLEADGEYEKAEGARQLHRLITQRVLNTRGANKEAYNAYQREYQRKYRAKKRKEAQKGIDK